MEKKKLTVTKVRNYLHKLSESIEKLSHEELHVSGTTNRFYLLSSLSQDKEAFFINLAIITTDEKMQVQIEGELLKWLDKNPLFRTHEWDTKRRQLF